VARGDTGFLLTGFFPTSKKDFYIGAFDDFANSFRFLKTNSAPGKTPR